MEIRDTFATKNSSIKEVMRVIDRMGLGMAVIVGENDRLLGIVTDGDVRRALASGADISTSIETVMRSDPIFVRDNDGKDKIMSTIKASSRSFSKYYTLKVPVVNQSGSVVNVAIISIGSGQVNFLSSGPANLSKVNSVLIVGGAGYLGSVLCEKLLSRGYKVRVLDNLLFGKQPVSAFMSNPNFELVEGDLRNIETVSKSLAGMDAVILLAAIVGDPAGRNDPKSTIQINYLASTALANACKYHQINRFIFSSTCSVYGLGDDILDETSPLNPVSLYARSKIETEKGILALQDKNFQPTILRMGTLYGYSHRMRFDLVVNIFAKMATIDKKIKIFGGRQWRPLLSVDDAALAYILCLESSIDKVGGVFNVGSNEQNYQILELGNIVKKVFPQTDVQVTDPEDVDGSNDPRDYKVSFEKVQKTFGFKPEHTVEGELKRISNAITSGKIANVNDPMHYNSLPKK